MTSPAGPPGRRHTATWYGRHGDDVVGASLLAFAQARGGEPVLDVGSGPGAYSRGVAERGRRIVAVDARWAYTKRARGPAVAAVQADGSRLPFASRTFTSVLLFEVLEHVPEPELLVAEAARVARANVLVTVPNCEGHERLQREAITFDHMLDDDHIHFFTPESLRRLLEPFDRGVVVERGDFLDTNLARLVAGRPGSYALEALRRMRLYRPRYPSRLFAEVRVGS